MLYGTDQPNNNFDYLFLDFLRVNTSSTGMFQVEHPLVCGCRKSVIFSISMHQNSMSEMKHKVTIEKNKPATRYANHSRRHDYCSQSFKPKPLMFLMSLYIYINIRRSTFIYNCGSLKVNFIKSFHHKEERALKKAQFTGVCQIT